MLGETYEEYQMDDDALDEENELKDLVDKTTVDEGAYCCASSALSNISQNIQAIEEEICNINSTYTDLLKRQVMEAYRAKRNRSDGMFRSETQLRWYEEFKKIYMFQRYQERDIYNAMRYLISSSIFPHEDTVEDLTLAPRKIRTLIEEYAYKIISGHFTKASICYAIYNYGRPYRPIHNEEAEDYIYLERCMTLLR